MIEDDTTPSERIEESIKSPYPEDGDVWGALSEALSSEFEEHEAALDDVRAAKFVDEATETQLEKLADLFELDRRTTETLGEFRARIKIALRTQVTSATLPEIREIIAVLLDLDPSSFELREPEDKILILEPRFSVDAVGEFDVQPNVLDELLGDVSAAGVNADAVLLAESSSIRVVAFGVRSEDFGQVGYWFGFDAFDGAGAFGAADSDDPVGETRSADATIVVAISPASAETLVEGFGASGFGAGAFDGNPDDADLEGETTTETASIVVAPAEVTSTMIAEGFGVRSFNGAGAFGAAGETDVEGQMATPTAALTIVVEPASSTTLTESFGSSAFGAGAFDGTPDGGDVAGETTTETAAIAAAADPASSTMIDDSGFGAGSFDGSGTFD